MLASALGDSIALAAIFFVLFPLIVTGLIAFAIAQVIGERRANQEYGVRRQDHSRG